VMRFGVHSTLRELVHARLRPPRSDATSPISPSSQRTPDGGLIADYLGPIGDPRELSARLSATPGVVEHGLFAPEMVSVILIAGESGVERRAGAKRDA
jgi:ribose 5-phosphate isomerase A